MWYRALCRKDCERPAPNSSASCARNASRCSTLLRLNCLSCSPTLQKIMESTLQHTKYQCDLFEPCTTLCTEWPLPRGCHRPPSHPSVASSHILHRKMLCFQESQHKTNQLFTSGQKINRFAGRLCMEFGLSTSEI